MAGNSHAYYDSFADELLSKFNRVAHLVSHRATTGNYHEAILRTVLSNFLSKRYSVKTGFVYKDEESVSYQVDILIIDEYDASAYIYQEGDFVIVRPQSVVAAIEVKTTLNAGQFDEAIRNIASVKKLADNPENIRGIVFAYNGSRPSKTTLNKWFNREAAQEISKSPRLGPTMFAFMKHSTLLLRLNFDNNSQLDDSNNYHQLIHLSDYDTASWPGEKGEGWQLRYLLALIYLACSRREFTKTHQSQDTSALNDLVAYSGALISTNYYQFGKGFVRRNPQKSDKRQEVQD